MFILWEEKFIAFTEFSEVKGPKVIKGTALNKQYYEIF